MPSLGERAEVASASRIESVEVTVRSPRRKAGSCEPLGTGSTPSGVAGQFQASQDASGCKASACPERPCRAAPATDSTMSSRGIPRDRRATCLWLAGRVPRSLVAARRSGPVRGAAQRVRPIGGGYAPAVGCRARPRIGTKTMAPRLPGGHQAYWADETAAAGRGLRGADGLPRA